MMPISKQNFIREYSAETDPQIHHPMTDDFISHKITVIRKTKNLPPIISILIDPILMPPMQRISQAGAAGSRAVEQPHNKTSSQSGDREPMIGKNRQLVQS